MSESQLFVVATPIGNLEDITYRAVRILSEVDFIICEDTRVSSKLLAHLEIKKELISFNAKSETKKIPYVLERLRQNQKCAIISDAGTPCISDPGIRLIKAVRDEGIYVAGIPGPSAAILALSISGIPTDSFIFEGFLPTKKGRQKKLKLLSQESRTIVIYESVYRIEKLLKEISEYMPDRIVGVCRELTKLYEEFLSGTAEQLLQELKTKNIKGEFVVVLAPINWH